MFIVFFGTEPGFPKILIESFVNLVLIPNWFNSFEPNFNLGLSFLFSSARFEKLETPFAFAAAKNMIKNSSIKLLLRLEAGDIFKFGWLYKYICLLFPVQLFYIFNFNFCPHFIQYFDISNPRLIYIHIFNF